MSVVDEIEDDDSRFPWEDVDASRSNAELQRQNLVEQGKTACLPEARAHPDTAPGTPSTRSASGNAGGVSG
jgi:hypothetical protein